MSYRVPQHIKDGVRRLWPTGLSTIKIGRELNISKNAVVGIRQREGLPARPSPIKNGNHGRSIAGAQAVAVARAKSTFSQISGRNASAERDRRAAIKPAPQVAPPPSSATCQYPLWGDRPADRLHPEFCGARALTGTSWCAKCVRIVFPGWPNPKIVPTNQPETK